MDQDNFIGDAFTNGIEPGGLRTKSDIRILICYILKSVSVPLSADEISGIMQEKALANYFEVRDALSALLSMGNISQTADGAYKLEPQGADIAANLDVSLPLSVRDKAVTAAMRMLATAKTERENSVTTARVENGYHVTCHISGGDMDLMRLTVYVPDLFQARVVKKNFHRDPQRIYSLLLASLTGDEELTKSILER